MGPKGGGIYPAGRFRVAPWRRRIGGEIGVWLESVQSLFGDFLSATAVKSATGLFANVLSPHVFSVVNLYEP